ncbi:MAG: 50S ribosomal protein L29 [Patescibacteria group bacterium]|nr:50S ribosomal protein L29 [Patescibacteria group bacterium]
MTKAQELRQESKESLEKKLKDLQKELMNLQMEHRTDGLVDTTVLSKKRREIAKIKTVLREKEVLAQIE